MCISVTDLPGQALTEVLRPPEHPRKPYVYGVKSIRTRSEKIGVILIVFAFLELKSRIKGIIFKKFLIVPEGEYKTVVTVPVIRGVIPLKTKQSVEAAVVRRYYRFDGE